MNSLSVPGHSSILVSTSLHELSYLRSFRRRVVLCGFLMLVGCGAWSAAAAQETAAARSLITRAVDESQRAVLRGNTHPLARAEFDRGAAAADQPMRRMVLVLQRGEERETALRALLDDQQTKGSSNYRHWVSPEQFGEQFGPSDSDLKTVKAWLESHGFEIAGVSKGRTTIEFSGTAGQVQEAFGAAIHKYVVNGAEHWANSNEPSIPSALAPVVRGVLSLHNFPRRHQSTIHGSPAQEPQDSASALFTYTSGKTTYYGLGPSDFATIYNVLPLWNAGVDGSGQTIAIVGETNINVTDIQHFRSIFGLPAKDPQIILNGPDPGLIGDEPEAVLDVSWSGAVAKNATIDLVVSASTEASLGVDLSALYIVDNNLAPVMSESYGECEAVLGTAGNAFYNALWQQAAAEGITVVLASGDGGSAGCDNFNTASAASDGLAVSGFASTPYNVAVGGTDFDQTAATASKYWSTTNNATTGASALGYIPETTWNQSCAGLGTGNCPSTSSELNIVGGSGGASNCATKNESGACLAGYAKPAWQSGSGVPEDGVRDLPDVSLFASSGFNGSFYIICEADLGFFGVQTGLNQPCNLAQNQFTGIGGTSAAAPAFAGIMALVNQKTASLGTGGRQGNANYILYKLAAQSGASCNSTTAAATGNSCIFYDITKGNDSVPCYMNTPNCGPTTLGGFAILVDANGNPAWSTGPGYDLATGLGSVNASNLVNAWSAVAYAPSTTTLTSLSPVNVVHGQQVNVSVTVAAKNGAGTPTGSVALMASLSGKSQSIGDFTLVNGVASGATALLPGGTYNVTAHYAGDGNFGSSDSAPLQVTVGKENSQTTAILEAYDLSTKTFSATNSVPYGTAFFLRGDVTNGSGTGCYPSPAQSGVACPTGSVSFIKNGAVLDAGSYGIGGLGYAEDQALATGFTALGNYTLQAQYGGDASYNASSGTLNMTVTQAPTYMGYFTVKDLGLTVGTGGYSAMSGQLFHVEAIFRDSSVMQAPTGAITFLANGNPLPGTIDSAVSNGSFSGGSGSIYVGYLEDTLATTIDTPGSYVLTASYPGDAHYSGSQSTYSLNVTVTNTTFNIAPPVANMTIAAPGQSGTTTVNLAGVGNFAGQVSLTCTLPSAMTEATCPAVSASLGNNTTAAAVLTITTTAAHNLTTSSTGGKGRFGFGALACVFLFALPWSRRRRFPLALLLLVVCIAGLGGCGGIGSGGTKVQTDPGTPAGTYSATVTATSLGITRTANFTVTVQ